MGCGPNHQTRDQVDNGLNVDISYRRPGASINDLIRSDFDLDRSYQSLQQVDLSR